MKFLVRALDYALPLILNIALWLLISIRTIIYYAVCANTGRSVSIR